MNKPIFESLKHGDKLVKINYDGNYSLYEYLCRDPHWQEKYAFLLCQDGSNTIHINSDRIESEFLAYDSFNEVKEYARSKRAEYCQNWLNKHTK